MVIADTSIWITFQRLPTSDVGRNMESLLAKDEITMVGPVLTEVLQGARSDAEYTFFADRLRVLDFIDTDVETWIRAGHINFDLKRQGNILALADVVIAALSMQHNVPLYTTDGDFNRIPGLQIYSFDSN